MAVANQQRGAMIGKTQPKPKRGGSVLKWCTALRAEVKRNRVICGPGLRQSITESGTHIAVSKPSTPPVAFTLSKKYFESSTAKLDIVNGAVFWGDQKHEISGTYPSTTTLSLVHGANHVYVDMTWGGSVTLARMSGAIPTPSDSSYKHWLGSWTVDVGAGTIINTFTAWPGGNIHLPAAYDG